MTEEQIISQEENNAPERNAERGAEERANLITILKESDSFNEFYNKSNIRNNTDQEEAQEIWDEYWPKHQ